jgi:hypothetical protein
VQIAGLDVLGGLLDAVLLMMEFPSERAGVALHGREMCRERFSASRMAEHLLDIYENVMKRA